MSVEKKTPGQVNFIVGIGASADGIPTLEKLFEQLPANTNMSFVVIQHMSPTRESILDQIIQRKTGMKVKKITLNMKPEPNVVYIPPVGHYLSVANNEFKLQKYDQGEKSLHLPIDHFFRSLAGSYKEMAVGVVLTGSGSDGSQGIKEIKQNSGWVIVQEPGSAGFESMPRNAIETGVVDIVCNIEEMPDKLIELPTKHDGIKKLPEDKESEKIVNEILEILKNTTRHDFSNYKRSTVLRRIKKRMMVRSLLSLNKYFEIIKKEEGEVHNLLKELLIGVTSFFRDKNAYEALEKKVIPELITNAGPNKDIRVWAAACSTGEEAYSMAILLSEHLKIHNARNPIRIFATDIDAVALDKARKGSYPLNIEADIPPQLLEEYFEKHESNYTIRSDIRDMVVFAEHSLIKDPPYSNLDLITCRNFLIYLNGDIQKKVVNTLHYGLKPDKYLFLGSSESVNEKPGLFEVIDTKYKIFKKRESRQAMRDFVNFSHERGRYSTTFPATHKQKLTLKEFAERRALKEYPFPFLVIGINGEILHSIGRCEDYFKFQVGDPDNNIVNAARDHIKIPISNALRKIKENGKEITINNIRDQKSDRKFDIRISPIRKPDAFNNLYTVVIFPQVNTQNETDGELKSKTKADSDEYITEIEKELEGTRDYLNSVIEELEIANEELKSANEEAQSSNEELQSANEELETSKEEMQSLNEELETSNAELQRKIREYSEVNNDLSNLMRNTQIGTLFLNKELKIQRFSPQVKDIISLKKTDEGRSISDFSIKFDGKALEAEAAKVLENLSLVQREIETENGKQYWMRIRPYRTLEDMIKGVVVTFIDITEKNKIQKIIKAKDEKFRNLFHYMDNGLAVYEVETDSKGKIKSAHLVEANPAFAHMMELPQDEILKKDISVTLPDSEMITGFMKFAPQILDGKTIHKEYYCKSLNKYFHVHSFSSEPNQIATLIQDVTQNKKEVIKYRRHLASIVEASEDAIFSISPDGKILWWNNGAEALYGYSKSEIVGKKAGDLISIPEGDEYSILIESLLEGHKVKSFETVHRNKNGKPIPVAITMSVIKGEAEEVIAISNIIQDISPIKQREEELIKARVETEKAARAKSAFLSNMSHEIRTPLNSILGFTGILKDLTNDENQKQILDTISNSGSQLLNLINDIIDVSRIEAGELKIIMENVSLNDYMKQIEDQFRGIIFAQKKKNVELQLSLPANEHIIQTDHHRLQQVLHNLISNAFKFTLEGKVEFGYDLKNGETVLFFVKDTGKGISKENQEALFKRFSQGELNPEDAIKGTGLGLTISKGIVEKMGGSIWLESEINKGTSVYFSIPYLAGANEPETESEDFDVVAPDLTGKTVLIVEDDDFSCEMLRYLVQKTGMKSLIAKDGEEAITLFANNKVDLVLLDIRLPKKNGYEVLQFIRRQNTEVPVIAETAHAMRDEVLNFNSLGFSGYLAKPISKDALYRILQKHMI